MTALFRCSSALFPQPWNGGLERFAAFDGVEQSLEGHTRPLNTGVPLRMSGSLTITSVSDAMNAMYQRIQLLARVSVRFPSHELEPSERFEPRLVGRRWAK
jgi:hypothetical protein